MGKATGIAKSTAEGKVKGYGVGASVGMGDGTSGMVKGRKGTLVLPFEAYC